MSRQHFFPCKCISDVLDGRDSTCQVPPAMIVELERDGLPVKTRPADEQCCEYVVQRLETWCRRCWDAGCDRNVKFRPNVVIDIVLEDDEGKGKGKAKANPVAQTHGRATISPAAVSSEAYAGPSGRQPASGRGITVTREITRTVTEAPVLAAPTDFGRNATNPGRASAPSVVMPPPPGSSRFLREPLNLSLPSLPVFGSPGAQAPPTPTTTITTSTPAAASNSNSNTTTTTSEPTRHSTARRVSERIRALASRIRNPDTTPSPTSSTSPAGRSTPPASGPVSSRARTTRTSAGAAPSGGAPAPPPPRSARTPAAKNRGDGARAGNAARK